MNHIKGRYIILIILIGVVLWLRDSQAQIRTISTESEKCCISVSLVMDRSGSLKWDQEGFSAYIESIKEFVRMMNDSCDEAALITFNEFVSIDVKMTKDTLKLLAAIDKIEARGSTAVWDAGLIGIEEVIMRGVNPCKGVVILTDGRDTASQIKSDTLMTLAIQHHIRLFTVGLGTSTNEIELQNLALQTGGKYYRLPGPSRILETFQNIYGELSNSITSVDDQTQYIVRSTFTLQQNYPNPFSISTTITYRLSSRSHVRLEVFDMLGRKIATLVDEEKEAGEHSSIFDIRNSNQEIPAGLHIYRLMTKEKYVEKKMLKF